MRNFLNKPITIVTGLILLVALTGCGGSSGDNAQPGTAGSSNSNSEANLESDGEAEEVEESPPLDHSAALAAGISGDTAITCLYTYDEHEFEQMKIAAMGSVVSPEATVYLNGSTVYWDIHIPGDKLAHVLGHEGTTYSWKIPDDGVGVKAKQDEPDADLNRVVAGMKKNTSDCAAYTGPESIFSVPSGIVFGSFPG